ncbi:hypothetical protein [Pseudomonas sp. WAC2]|uniref:hypothetical protein n=1 Tax=Pseudomonas sp. WAC2 TaxID=3055057 RepID=UPI0025AF14F0|nr:hypothetical protein [Pseudomonas sp. WAC2]MDN3234318.1 hypothetical protein [Pseudomonas sp. WAC2]
MNEHIGNITIGAAIARNQLILREHFFEPLLELEEYLKLLEDIRSVTSDPALQAQLVEKWENEVYELNEGINGLDEEIAILFRHVRYACLYLELAKAAENNKDCERAWAFNNEASLITGGIIEESAVIQKEVEANRRAKQNSENGKGRIRNFLPAKQEAARLLDKLKPEGGWPTLASAVSALDEPLGNFIDTNRIGGIKSSNIRVLLEKNWIPKDALVNNAWLNSKRS